MPPYKRRISLVCSSQDQGPKRFETVRSEVMSLRLREMEGLIISHAREVDEKRN